MATEERVNDHLKKLRILFVSNNYRPYSGGVVSALTILIEELLKQGHQVKLITLDFGVQCDDETYVIRIPSAVTFLHKGNHMAIPWRLTAHMNKIIEEFAPDIIHSHHPFLLGEAAQNLARKKNIPLIFTYHTQYEEYAHYIPLLPEPITAKTITFLVQRFCARTNSVIVPTESIRKQLEKIGIKKISVIPTPIRSHFFSENSFKKNERFRLLTVSRFAPEKNLFFLLDLMRILNRKQYQLTLVGYGVLHEELKNYAFKVCGFSQDDIRFIHKPAREALVQEYKEADLFIFSSKTETQGLVLAEAMAAGLPVIALNATGSSDIVQSMLNGFLVDTADQMKEKIELIAGNHTLYKNLSEGAEKTAQRYQAKNCISKLIEQYYALIVT